MPNENLLLWDWNKRESPFHIETIWVSRAAGFLANGLPLPSLHPSHTTFARRFRFSPHTKLYLSESHSQAVRPEIINGINRVMIHYQENRAGRRNFHDTVIDRVFICRSGAWVPPWHDQAFNEFVASFALPVIDVGTYPREWSLASAEERTVQLQQLKNRSYAQV